MGARTHFANILGSQVVRRINFSLDGFDVRGTYLGEVGEAIRGRRIEVYQDSSLPAHVAAYYSIGDDRMNFREYSPQIFAQIPAKASLVHEAVHAMIDMRQIHQLTALTGECGAFLAESVFRLASGQDLRGWADTHRNTPSGLIYFQAVTLIDQHRFGPSRTPRLNFLQYDALRRAIHAHPTYNTLESSSFHGADGVP